MKNKRATKSLNGSAAQVSRRKFIGMAGAALALPTFIPASALGLNGKTAPSNRIVMGMIGCGTMGTGNLKSFLTKADCQVVATCDVDKNHLQKATSLVNERYKDKGCKTYHNFHELLARTDIDAVMQATPDHWHGLVATAAAKAKKDIYGEKPLARTIMEQQMIVKAVEENGRIYQMGSWQRSVANFHKAAEIVRNGYIGTVKRIEVGLPKNYNNAEERRKNEMNVTDVPPELDYDMWSGPSKLLPYIPARMHRDWRWNYNTGGGQLMDWVGHHCDIAHWGCDFDNSGPSEVQGHGDFPPKGGVWDAAKTYRIELKYPGGVEMTMGSVTAELKNGTKWIGTDGWVHVNRNEFSGSKDEWSDYKRLPDEMRKVKLYLSTDHHQNFLDCVKSRKPTITPAQTGHHSAVPGHLGLISMLLGGRKLRWDVASEKIIGDDEASKMMGRDFRSPWDKV